MAAVSRLLSILAQLSGSVDKQYHVFFHLLNISFEWAERVKQKLESFHIYTPNNEKSDVFSIGEIGRPVGRLLSQLGVDVEGENKFGVSLPAYLLRLSELYAFDQTVHMDMALHSSKQLGEQVVYLLNSVFPDESFRLQLYSRESKDRSLLEHPELFQPYVSFSGSAFRRISSELATFGSAPSSETRHLPL